MLHGLRMSADVFGEEFAHHPADLGGVGLKREMAAIDEVDLGGGDVAPEGFSSRRDEERVILAPNAEHVACAREAMQQQDRLVIPVASLAVEELEAIDIGGVETNGHCDFSLFPGEQNHSQAPERRTALFSGSLRGSVDVARFSGQKIAGLRMQSLHRDVVELVRLIDE
jgi:hypothetical protein